MLLKRKANRFHVDGQENKLSFLLVLSLTGQRQESIPVGCIPLAFRPYEFRWLPLGGEYPRS